MVDTENVGGRDRLARVVLAVVLAIAALRSLRNGKRVRGLLAGIGALAFGFTASTKYCGVNDALGIDTTGEGVSVDIEELGSGETSEQTVPASAGSASAGGHELTCAACGEPIVPGQRRGPNADDEIVHDDCK